MYNCVEKCDRFRIKSQIQGPLGAGWWFKKVDRVVKTGIVKMVTHSSGVSPRYPSLLPLNTHMSAAGSLIYIHCLRSRTIGPVQDQLGFLAQRLHGWFTIRQDCVDYFVPEDRAYLLYTVDPHLERLSHLDYVA